MATANTLIGRHTPYRGTAGRRDREDDEGHAWMSDVEESATAPRRI